MGNHVIWARCRTCKSKGLPPALSVKSTGTLRSCDSGSDLPGTATAPNYKYLRVALNSCSFSSSLLRFLLCVIAHTSVFFQWHILAFWRALILSCGQSLNINKRMSPPTVKSMYPLAYAAYKYAEDCLLYI